MNLNSLYFKARKFIVAGQNNEGVVTHMQELTLTKEQKSAIASLKRAFTKCKKANIYFHNCYGNLIAYDGNIVERVDDDIDELPCHEGKSLTLPYSLESWADDPHYVHRWEK